MGKNDVLLIGGIAAAVLLFSSKGDGSPLFQLGDIVANADSPEGGSGGGGVFDFGLESALSDLYGYINDAFSRISGLETTVGDINTGLGNLDLGLSGVVDFLNNPDNFGLGGGGGGENGGGGQGWLDPIQPSGNVLVDLANSIGKVATSGMIVAGTYLGAKALIPAAPAIAGAISSGVGGVTTALQGAGGGVSTLASGGLSALAAPASLSVGTVASVAAVGAGSYLGTTWLLENTKVGKSINSTLTGWADRAGDWVFQRDDDEAATLNETKANAAFMQYGYTVSDIRNLQSDYGLVGASAIEYMKKHPK